MRKTEHMSGISRLQNSEIIAGTAKVVEMSGKNESFLNLEKWFFSLEKIVNTHA